MYITTPKTKLEMIELLRHTNENVLSKRERKIIASAMTFNDAIVSDVMLEKPAITFVRDTEFLGPLVLDRLYKSGFKHFPVVDANDNIVGTLSTEKLNSLAVRDLEQAFKYMDQEVFYVRTDYTLEEAFAAFLRTNSYFFMVVSKKNEIVGLITIEMLLSFLLGKVPRDDFDRDNDRRAVSTR